MAPVARRVADAEEDRHVALAGGGERLRSPRVPVDRVVAVLAEVGRRLVGQPIHAGTLPIRTVRGLAAAFGNVWLDVDDANAELPKALGRTQRNLQRQSAPASGGYHAPTAW